MRNIQYRLFSLRFILFFVLLLIVAGVNAADDFPARPQPQRLVNDFSGILSSAQAQALENKLDAFNKQTSTQIAIVIVKDLFGHDTGEYAYQLAENWGIGQKGKNNGILILVKPKTDNREKGKVFIAVGYGLEGAVPDFTAQKTIVSAEILPSFKVNDYYTGLDRATSVLMSLTAGEFTADQYDKKAKTSVFPGLALLMIIFAVFMLFNRNKSRTVGADGSTGSLLGSLWLLSMLGGRGGGGSWNDFSGGGGGSSGGFGGFGGGSFGGGGAGGEW